MWDTVLASHLVSTKPDHAHNVFYLDVPRLSVDIDLNHVGDASVDVMISEKPLLADAVAKVRPQPRLQSRGLHENTRQHAA